MTALGEKAVALAQSLIRCESVTPRDAGAIEVLVQALKPARFTCEKLTFSEGGGQPIEISMRGSATALRISASQDIPTSCRSETRSSGGIRHLPPTCLAGCCTVGAPPT